MMGRARFNNHTLRHLALALILTCCFIQPAFAQDTGSGKPAKPLQSSKPLSWQDACKRLESDDADECLKCEAILRQALGTDDRTEEMACALALFCFRRQGLEETKKTLAGVRAVFPKPSKTTLNFASRMQLCLLLTDADESSKAQATAIFRDLVVRTSKDTTLSSSDMRANAALVGTVCGMLQSKQAGPLLNANDLTIAEKCMLECPSKEVVSSFKFAHQNAVERAAEIERTIERISKLEPEKVAEEQKVREERLAELKLDFESQQEEKLDAISSVRAEDKENTSERRQISQTLRNLDKEWKTPTPGHPGPRPSKPSEPRKSDVDVDEHHVVNNQRVRKSDAQIRREEADEWQRLQDRYRRQLSNYETAAKHWGAVFDAWQTRDNARRTNLKNQQMAAKNRQQQVLANLAELKAQKADAAEDLKSQRTELGELSAEYEMIEIATAALAAKSPAIAFRPPHFELIHVSSETQALLSQIRSLK